MTDFADMRVWSKAEATSDDPICLDDILEDDYLDRKLSPAEESRRTIRSHTDKKKRRRRRRKKTDDDSSVAESVLSSILSESDEIPSEAGVKTLKHNTPTIEEMPRTKFDEKRVSEKSRRRERLAELKASRKNNAPRMKVQPMRTSMYPSSSEEDNGNNEKSQTQSFVDRKRTSKAAVVDDDDLSKNPFSNRNNKKSIVEEDNDDDDDLSKNPFSNRNKKSVAEDDDLSQNPFSDQNETIAAAVAAIAKYDKNASVSNRNTNPFGDDSVREREASDSEVSSTIRPPPLSTYLSEAKVARKKKSAKKDTNPFSDDEDVYTVEDDAKTAEEESDDDDVVSASKRLLRCVDQRMQYQQQNDSVKSLKAELKQMRVQAEAMAEQLRRAVETKCDLVLAQNEMERGHEQSLIAKEAEMKDLRLYIQDILDAQAQSELNLMNEMASLANKLDDQQKKSARETERKDRNIAQLEQKIESMRVSAEQDGPTESFFGGISKIMIPSFE